MIGDKENNVMLEKLKQLQISSKLTAIQYTTGNTVDLLPLSIKQQKEVLKTALDSITSPISFAIVTTEILQTNLLSKETLTLLDKIPLLIALRVNSFGNIWKDQDLTNIESALKDAFSFEQKLTEDKIELITKLPTLAEDYQVNLECRRVIDQKKGDDQNKLKEFVGELFVYEFLKFISAINLQIEGKIEVIDFSMLSIPQRLQILENLPLTLTNKLVDFISQIRNIEKQQSNIGDIQISLDASFFTKD